MGHSYMCGQIILVVEDEVMIRILIADVLRDEGYHVIEAASGDEALSVLASDQHVDLIITDVRMPGEIDGVELTVRSKRAHPSRPVIIVSGHLPPEAADAADAFLPKPFVPSQVLDMIDTLIGPPCQKSCQDRNAS